MSYKVLARKWRPQHFRDMIGQEAVLRALGNALDTDRLHHAYLFTGMRGVGKTTIARILAKCLNCEANGVSSSPCGECSVCKDIEEGRFLDLIEVDAASRTKVDETRELLENVPYAPASGRYKVYLIDEVHMFSSHSFNALLKTLEEPPAHVKFVLATTDPQKVPVTVLSRCLQFNLKRLPAGRLTDYLAHVLDEEAIEHERSALELIARASEGSVRDSLSLVEQATAYGEGAVRHSDVEAMLGRVSTDRLLGLIDVLVDRDTASLFQSVEALAEYAPDYHELLGELLSLLHRIALLQQVPDALDPVAIGQDRLQALAGRVAPDTLQLLYQIGLHARRDMPFAPDPRECFDMALLRMQMFQPQMDGAVVSESAAKVNPPITPATAQKEPDAPAAASSGMTPATHEPEAAVSASTPAADHASASVNTQAGPEPAPMATSLQRTAAPDSQAMGGSPEAPGSSAQQRSASPRVLEAADWSETVTQLGLSGMPRQLAAHSCLKAHVPGRVSLLLEADSEHLNTPRFNARLENALSEHVGEPTTLQIEVVSGETLESTPARLQALSEQEALEAARQAISQDPNVQRLIASVDGAVDPDSVRPSGPVDPQES